MINEFISVSGVLLANAALDTAFHDTYYVVAFLGFSFILNCLFDYMLKFILHNYLLYKFYCDLFQVDKKFYFKFLNLYSNNNNYSFLLKKENIKLAENLYNFSETTRQIYFVQNNNYKFFSCLAGIIDGKGFLVFKFINSKVIFKNLKIRVSTRDIKILKYIINKLRLGKIILSKCKLYSTLIFDNLIFF